MQTKLDTTLANPNQATEAESILRSCVHCGFCNATCPTYQILGDELDGPRGRIYLIKQMLEGGEVTRKTQTHLDRCLSCRNCETTCPSGVKYHNLLDIGREHIQATVKRPLKERLLHMALRHVIPRPAVFGVLLKTGQILRPVLPRALAQKVPHTPKPDTTLPFKAKSEQQPQQQPQQQPPSQTQVLLLEACVQPALSPNTRYAAIRVLSRLNIDVVPQPKATPCCGAHDMHMGHPDAARQHARRNIDAWWPQMQQGNIKAISHTASGCGAFIKEYGHLLKDDTQYAEKAQHIAQLAQDLTETVAAADLSTLKLPNAPVVAAHCPCTLQHAQKLPQALQTVLSQLGINTTAVPDSHLCCGAAGTYAITQPQLASQLRDHKLDALEKGKPELIVTANIACQVHLNSAARTPVRHWIELVDELLIKAA